MEPPARAESLADTELRAVGLGYGTGNPKAEAKHMRLKGGALHAQRSSGSLGSGNDPVGSAKSVQNPLSPGVIEHVTSWFVAAYFP
jgi:hypothetical protein